MLFGSFPFCPTRGVCPDQAPFSAPQFLPNTFRLQLALRGSKPKIEVASARRKLPDEDSTLPRLLTTVYTPLLRCATASDTCNFACGLRTKQTGSCCQVPRFAFLGLASDASILSEPPPTESQNTREVVYRRSLQASTRTEQLCRGLLPGNLLEIDLNVTSRYALLFFRAGFASWRLFEFSTLGGIKHGYN